LLSSPTAVLWLCNKALTKRKQPPRSNSTPRKCTVQQGWSSVGINCHYFNTQFQSLLQKILTSESNQIKVAATHTRKHKTTAEIRWCSHSFSRCDRWTCSVAKHRPSDRSLSLSTGTEKWTNAHSEYHLGTKSLIANCFAQRNNQPTSPCLFQHTVIKHTEEKARSNHTSCRRLWTKQQQSTSKQRALDKASWTGCAHLNHRVILVAFQTLVLSRQGCDRTAKLRWARTLFLHPGYPGGEKLSIPQLLHIVCTALTCSCTILQRGTYATVQNRQSAQIWPIKGLTMSTTRVYKIYQKSKLRSCQKYITHPNWN